jgi:hypothetical protein
MSRLRLLLVSVSFANLLLTSTLAAQAADTVRGRVLLPDSTPAVGVMVAVTPVGTTASVTATTDSSGAYTALVERAERYLVVGSLAGYATVRTQVARPDDARVVVADLRLAPVRLDPVKVQARRRNRVPSSGQSVPTGEDAAQDDARGFVAPGELGDLSSLAAMVPGVLRTGDGFSIFGLPADQNSVTLNGAPIPLTTLPPGAVQSSFSAMPFNAAQGGFSGGQLRLSPSSTPLIYHNWLGGTLDLPALQFTDRTSARLGQKYTNVNLDGLHSGPLVLGKATYNLSYRLGRHYTDLTTLLSADAAGLARAGLASDSVASFLAQLDALGIPATVGAVPRHQASDNASVMATVASWPSSPWARRMSLSALGGWTRSQGFALGPTTVPAAGSGTSSRSGALQGELSAYTGNFLHTMTATLSGSDSRTDAYLALPGASVRMGSDAGDIALLGFGGAGSMGGGTSSWAAHLRHGMFWRSVSDAHRYQTSAELRVERATTRAPVDYGRYFFNSLADLSAGQPASYSRILGAPSSHAAALSGAVSIGDVWQVRNPVFLQYGVRADFQRFGARPAQNAAVDSIFGRRTDHAPGGVWASPRVGFLWMVLPTQKLGKALSLVHGGAGRFVGTFPTTLLEPAMLATGLPSGVQQLTCVGEAVPTPDWTGYSQDPARIPTTCVDGSPGTGLFTDTVPRVQLFAPDYSAPTSWRANLGVMTRPLGAYFLRLEGTFSRSVAQPGLVDLNFSGVPRFTLADEGDRPVFVSPAGIVPTTGAVATGEARRATHFADVLERRSDLRSEARQLIFSVGKRFATSWDVGGAPKLSRTAWTITYAYSQVRDEVRGTSAPTAADPNSATWGRSGSDIRHNITGQLTTRFSGATSVTLFGRLRSGIPFTPTVLGDINGDGRYNDPAFIFDPSTATDPAVNAGMMALLAGAPASVRSCLTRQLGRVAGRNSCTAPWSASLDAQATFDLSRLRMPKGASATLSAVNLLGGIDQLFHGSNVRGWGQVASPDPVLLSVTGFDPATQRFRYEVNQRFGDTRPVRSVRRSPMQLTLQFRIPLGPSVERQTFRQALTRVEQGRRVRRPADEIVMQFVASASSLTTSLIWKRDTLLLSPDQIAQLNVIEREHQQALGALWMPVAEELANLPDPLDERAAHARVQATRRSQRDLLVRYVTRTRDVLTPYQLDLLPRELHILLDPQAIAEVD